MPLTVLIVDDEPLAREGLRMLLEGDADVSAIHEARNGREALEIILRARPDLLFLDVQMPEMDGFGLLRELGAESMPAVVFVTAHDRYAIQAFEVNALDYLLKPVTASRFTAALGKVKTRLHSSSPDASREILSVLAKLSLPLKYSRRIAVRSGGKTLFVDVNDIEWIEAEENYVKLYTSRGTHLVHAAMAAVERSLDPELFLRVHRSLIVNLRCVLELQPSSHGEYVLTLANGLRLQSGRMYNAKLRALTANRF